MAKLFVGDIGTVIALDAKVDLTNATVLEIKYFKPDGSGSGKWTATIDPQNNTIATYTTADSDLDVAGVWTFQLYVELPSWSGHGEMASQRIYEPIEVTS